MTRLELNSIGLEYDEKDTFSDYDKIFVNEPWNWGPQQLFLKEGFGHESQKPIAPTTHAESYAMPVDPYSSRPKFSSPTRKIAPLNAREVTDDMPRIGYISTEKRDGALSGPLSDEQKMLLYPLAFGFSLKTKQWSK